MSISNEFPRNFHVIVGYMRYDYHFAQVHKISPHFDTIISSIDSSLYKTLLKYVECSTVNSREPLVLVTLVTCKTSKLTIRCRDASVMVITLKGEF